MRGTLAAAACLLVLAATAATAGATPPGINGIFALDGVTGAGNIHTTPSTPGGPVTRITFDAAQENDAAWSPDGTRIAFTSRRDGGDPEIYIMNADGSNARRFTVSPGIDEQPSWSPDGARIAWASDRGGDNLEIYSANIDGTDLRRHTLNGAIPDTEPEWSPDGSAIAFTSNRTGNGDIYRLSPAGTEVDVRRLTSDAASEGSPTWSPDGSRVAFDSARGGNTNIWSVAAGGGPEADLRQHTSNASGDQEPTWSPDGTRIAFSSLRAGANWDIWTVAANGPAESSPVPITSNGGTVNEFQPAWQSVAPAPALAALSPGGVVAGSGDLAVIVDGSNFVRRSTVRWNGQPRSTQFVSPTRLTFVAPAGDLTQPGGARVTVSTSPVGGGESAGLAFAVNPGIVLTKALLQPRWKASRLRGRLDLRGVVGRPALLRVQVLRASGRGKALVTRRFLAKQPGAFARRLRLAPTLVPGRYLVRVTEVGGGPPLPPAQRGAKLSAPREGVVARAFFSTKIGGRPMNRIRGRSIVFAHFRFAARPKKGKRLTVRWFSPGARRPVAIDRKPPSRLVIAFIKGSGRLPKGTWRAELRYGRTLVATARTRVG